MTEAPNSNNQKKRTVGEELFLVHLSRFKQGDDDEDHRPSKRHAAMTMGEELWRIHCQRSQGHEEEAEETSGVSGTESSEETAAKKKNATEDHPVVHRLRNRDITV